MRETSRALEAIDLAAAGDWEGAHKLVQDEDSVEAAWAHAHLHRAEGDFGNAGYWYRRADKPMPKGDVAEERRAIQAALKAG